MIRNIQDVTRAMVSRITSQEVTANNIANSNTAGFKKDRIFQEALDQAGKTQQGSVRQVTVFEQGPLKNTGNPLDIALSGDGFFSIEADGREYYTRDGNFKVDPDGLLRLESGGLVMGESGPIQAVGDITIDKQGSVFVKGTEVDRLKIVSFPDSEQLRKHGNTLFRADDDAISQRPSNVSVMQGYIEGSNVNPMEEMVSMMTAYRYFEADQKVLQTHDEILDKAANQIGRI